MDADRLDVGYTDGGVCQEVRMLNTHPTIGGLHTFLDVS